MVILTDQMFSLKGTINLFMRCDLQLGEMTFDSCPIDTLELPFHFKDNCQFEAIRFNKCRMYPSWLKRERGAADAIRHTSIAAV